MTLPPLSPRRVLVIGKSKGVLTETAELLRGKGYAADATNEFDRVLETFDVTAYDVVVFGGMVPPEMKVRLHDEISARNAHVVFVQGFAGIPGLITAQVEAAAGAHNSSADVEYEAASRSVRVRLDEPCEVRVVAWWGTSFVPPEPKSTSMAVLDEKLPAGSHDIVIPDKVPTRGSFVTVSIGSTAWAFIVGVLPPGATLAEFAGPASS
jgi:hypothetical protein